MTDLISSQVAWILNTAENKCWKWFAHFKSDDCVLNYWKNRRWKIGAFTWRIFLTNSSRIVYRIWVDFWKQGKYLKALGIIHEKENWVPMN